MERQARADLTRIWNDLDLAPDATADDVLAAHRAPLEERVEAVRQDDPALATKLEEWGRAAIARPVAYARQADDKRAREATANMQAERMVQIERGYERAVVDATTGPTAAIREAGAAALVDLREEAAAIWAARDPGLAAANAAHWEPRLAETAMQALSTESFRTGTAGQFLETWRKGGFRDFTSVIDKGAVMTLMDRHSSRMGREAAAATAQQSAAIAATKAHRAKIADAALYGMTQTGASRQRIEADYFAAGGTAKGWGDILKKTNEIEKNRAAIGDRARWDSPGIKAREGQLRLEHQGITSKAGVIEAKQRLLELEAEGIVSPDGAEEARSRLDLVSARLEHADSVFEDAFKEHVYDPLVKEVGLTAGGLQLMLDDKAPQAAYLERVIPLVKEVAAQKGMDAGEATAWRQLISGIWTMQMASTGQAVDLTVDDARAHLRNIIGHIATKGFAEDATDEQVMGIIDAAQPNRSRLASGTAGSVATYAAFEDGRFQSGLTAINMQAAQVAPGERTAIWLNILNEKTVADSLRGITPVPRASERAKEVAATNALAEDTVTQREMPPTPGATPAPQLRGYGGTGSQQPGTLPRPRGRGDFGRTP